MLQFRFLTTLLVLDLAVLVNSLPGISVPSTILVS